MGTRTQGALDLTRPDFARAPLGILRHAARERRARHCHDAAFTAVVLSGGYQEAGDEGRWNVGPGDVIIHRAFESHLDRFDRGGAEVLILRVPPELLHSNILVGAVRDPDSLARLAENDLHAAEACLAEFFVPSPRPTLDWPDLLAARLRQRADFVLAEWAASHDLRPETLSRGFRSAYGCTPRTYRSVMRARAAFTELGSRCDSLSAIAQELQFSDQAHMTRAVSVLTGESPRAWRMRSSGFKTA